MKKKLTLSILALLAVTLTGCEKETKEQRSEHYASCIITISYKGHNYIVLNKGRYTSGITHDPDCPCHQKGGSHDND